MTPRPTTIPLACMLALAACGDPTHSNDAGSMLDASTPSDASAEDADTELDASHDVADAAIDGSTEDAGAPPAFGTIHGTCGLVRAELDEPSPSFVLVHFAFPGDGFQDPAERPLLTAGAQEILAEGTSGGSSGVSEAFAFEVLARCEGASLIKTETEIVYDPKTSAKTDILVSIDDIPVGVSVTRAMSYPAGAPYPTSSARFIEGKLRDVLESTMNVVEADSWGKQIFVVVAMGEMHAESIRTVWESFDPATRADTIIYVVITDGQDDLVYFE